MYSRYFKTFIIKRKGFRGIHGFRNKIAKAYRRQRLRINRKKLLKPLKISKTTIRKNRQCFISSSLVLTIKIYLMKNFAALSGFFKNTKENDKNRYYMVTHTM